MLLNKIKYFHSFLFLLLLGAACQSTSINQKYLDVKHKVLNPIIKTGRNNNKALNVFAFKQAVENGAVMIDLRSKDNFSLSHIPNSIFMAYGNRFEKWFETLVPEKNTNIVFIHDHSNVAEIILKLEQKGYSSIIGYLNYEKWTETNQTTNSSKNISAKKFSSKTILNQSYHILDVRSTTEFEQNHVKGAQNIPLSILNNVYLGKFLNKEFTYYVYCGSGYRSLIACSILEKKGFKAVNIKDGFSGLSNTDIPMIF